MSWPEQIRSIRYRCHWDDTLQPALFYDSGRPGPRPLLVALHTWSCDYDQDLSEPYVEWCIAHDWTLILPSFRGPNRRPDACGSDAAANDILDAVRYARANAPVDERRLYLAGLSGGGHAALQMATAPGMRWAGVSAWVPIADLAVRYDESRVALGLSYAEDLVQCCGGAPGAGPEVDEQYELRSPLFRLHPGIRTPMDINAGIRDGHTGSVPVSHSLRAFNAVAAGGWHVSEELIAELVERAQVPAGEPQPAADPAYGEKRVLFRREYRNKRVTLFDGGHEMIFEAGLGWLAQQEAEIPEPAEWDTPDELPAP